ncbi:3'(2'),5'-bisphosphate nucleotidase 1 [Orussus abietinus]|uniref:3'(2'),5'-bisphosphate nucleotidase 1 n=1 Tax=Orussus abietinus TaxID=222816 RepID=UPI000625BF60|nr:3'(2'),5'-bisphosphate nucleotidase 1 [Orussus abietinus]XP_012275916.1 3'(2'),5'-bisphosphate nucleotidase 1 [Orussus abietinus]
MAQNVSLLTRIVASSVTVVTRAGKIIRDVMSKGELNIVDKGNNDLQTLADRSAQLCIVTSLRHQFPTISIIGEEDLSVCEVPFDWVDTEADPEILKLKLPPHLETVEAKDVCVWVDPLDGTAEYAQGLVEHVTILVGVAIGKRAVGGIIHQPYYKNSENGMLGRTLWGIEGVGVHGFKAVLPPEGKRIITTTRSHLDNTVQAALDAMLADDIIRVGGAGHKVVLLLEGKAHAYVFASKGCKRWDTCAPEAILHAAGGTLTDIHGATYSYDAETNRVNSGGVLATAPGQDHDWYISRIPHEVKRNF